MPARFFGPAPTHQFFERADMMDTAVGTAEKNDAAEAGQERLPGHDEGRGRCGQWVEEQGPDSLLPTSSRQVPWPGSIARWPNRVPRNPGGLSAWQLGFNVETTEMFEPCVAGAIHEMK
jgi:hypothetical protein